MEKRKFGDVLVPVIGQGTWRMENNDAAACIRALQVGLDLGMTHLDTAELYGDGGVEEAVVKPVIEGRRDEVFLVSKVRPWGASRRGTIEACEASLARLGTDHLDAFLLHWPGEHPLEDTLAAFEELQAAGKIKAYGVSNFPSDQLREAVRIAGPGKIACNQVLHHLEERAVESNLLATCKELGVALVSYSPLGAGKFPADHEALLEVGLAHHATPHQIALAFLRDVDDTHLLIPKASTEAHVRANAAAGVLKLTDDERARIEAAFPRGAATDRLPTL
jgi:diketogulonate reductase-like aldo/keto reductase